MKRLKLLMSFAVLGVAWTVSLGAGSASATELTCNGSLCPVGTVIEGHSEGHVVLDAPIGKIECSVTSEGNVASPGSATTTPTGKTGFTSYSCTGGAVVTVLNPGTGETHTAGASNNGNGTITSTGSEVTVETFGLHCIFRTNNTDVGVITGSNNTGGLATFDLSATIPRVGGRSGAFCGSSAPYTGSSVITSPTNLAID